MPAFRVIQVLRRSLVVI